jgi:hypothetical protein
VRTVKGYKLFKQRRDGSLGPLFINARQRIKVGEWMKAEDHPTKGYQHRPGWHAALLPVAPHLCERGRVWAEVRMTGCRKFDRPQSLGGTWVLADALKVVEVFDKGLPADLKVINLEAAIRNMKTPTIHMGLEEDGKLYASWRTTGTNRHYVRIDSVYGLGEIMSAAAKVMKCDAWEALTVQASISMDFPDEHTDDPEVIELCRRYLS